MPSKSRTTSAAPRSRAAAGGLFLMRRRSACSAFHSGVSGISATVTVRDAPFDVPPTGRPELPRGRPLFYAARERTGAGETARVKTGDGERAWLGLGGAGRKQPGRTFLRVDAAGLVPGNDRTRRREEGESWGQQHDEGWAGQRRSEDAKSRVFAHNEGADFVRPSTGKSGVGTKESDVGSVRADLAKSVRGPDGDHLSFRAFVRCRPWKSVRGKGQTVTT
jgi:hypothetical protein